MRLKKSLYPYMLVAFTSLSATNYDLASPDQATIATIGIDTTSWDTDDFDTLGLDLEGNGGHINSTLKLGYTGAGAATSLAPGDLITLENIAGRKLTLLVDMPDANYTIRPPVVIETIDETLSVNPQTGRTLIFDSNISGDGIFRAAGPGYVVWGGSDNSGFTGQVYIEDGEFEIAPSSTFNGFMHVSPGALARINGPAASERLHIDGTLFLEGQSDYTVPSTLHGSGGVAVNHDGMVTLTGSNTVAGGFSVNRGILRSSVAPAGNIFIGEYDSGGGAMLPAHFRFQADQPIHYSGTINGQGQLHKYGSETLTLDNAHTNDGGLLVWEGTVALDENSFDNNIWLDSNTTLVLDIESNHTYSDVVSLGATQNGSLIRKTGSGTLTVDGVITYGNFELESGSLILPETSFATTLSGDFLNEGALQVSVDSVSAAYPYALTGSGSFDKRGTGRLDFTGSVDQTGPMIITQGSVRFTENAQLGDISNEGAVEFNISSGQELESHSALTGSGSLEKLGAGHLILDNPAQTYQGGTTVTAGTLETLFPVDNGNYAVASGANLVYDIATEDLTTTGVVSGAGTWFKRGPHKLNLASSNTISGVLQVDEGEMEQSQANTLNTNISVTINEPGLFDLNDFNASMGSLSGAGYVELGSATLTTGSNDSSTTFSGVISETGSLVKVGTGAMTLSGSNTYTGDTLVSAGTILQGAANVLSADSQLNIASGATFDAGAFDGRADGIVGSGTLDVGHGATTFTHTGLSGEALTFSGNIVGSANLVKQGAGAWTLTQQNWVDGNIAASFIGNLDIQQGSVIYGVSNALRPANSINIASGALWDLNDYDSTIHQITGSGFVDLGSGVLTIEDVVEGYFEFGGVIRQGSTGNPYSLVKTGWGDIELTGASTYVGDTHVEQGAMIIGTTNALPVTTHVHVSVGGLLDVYQNNQQITGLTGTGQVWLDAATLTISENSTDTFDGLLYSDTASSLTISGNKHFILSSSANPTGFAGFVTVNNGSTFEIRDNMFTASSVHDSLGHIRNAGTVILHSDKDLSTSISDPHDTIISGAGTVEITGSGHIDMTAQQIYTGPTHIQSGTLHYGIDQALPAATSVAIDSGATLDMNQHHGSFVALTGLGTVKMDESSELTLTHNTAQTFSGTINGQVSGTSDAQLFKTGTGALTFASTALSQDLSNFELLAGSLDLQGDMHHGIVLDGSSSYTLNTTGTHTLSGPQSSHSNEAIEFSSTASSMLWRGDLVIGGDAFIGRTNGTANPTINIQDGRLLLTDASQSYSFNQSVTHGSPALHLNSGYGLSVDVATDSTLTSNLVFDQAGTLTKEGAGNFVLTSNQLYTGTTTISAGTLTLNEGVELDTTALVNNANWVITGTADTARTFDFPVTGTGTLTIDAPVTIAQKLSFPNHWNYRGATVLTEGYVENTGMVTLDTNSHTVDPNAVWMLRGATVRLHGDSTLVSGLVLAADNTVITTTGAPANILDTFSEPYLPPNPPHISWSTTDTSPTTEITIGSGTHLELNASDRSMEIAIDISGPGSLRKTGAQRAVLSPQNITDYMGTTTVEEGTLVLDDKFHGTNTGTFAPVTINSGATLALRNLKTTTEVRGYISNDVELGPQSMTYTIPEYTGAVFVDPFPEGGTNNYKEYGFAITGAGDLRIEQPAVDYNAIYLSNELDYTGETYIVDKAFLYVDDNFNAQGDVIVDGTLHIYTPDLGEDGFHYLDNDFYGATTGRIEKYGPGILVLAGSFEDYAGTIRTQGGEVFFSALPAQEIENNGIVNLLALGGSIITLNSGTEEYFFSGTVTGETNTRYLLNSEMHHDILTINSLELDGRIDLRQSFNGTLDPMQTDSGHPAYIDAALVAKPQFRLNTLAVEPKSRFVFQFDQAYTGWAGVDHNSERLRPMAEMNFTNDSGVAQYILQAVNDADLFFDHRYRLLTFENTPENESRVDEILSLLRAPAMYVVQAQKVFDIDNNRIYLDAIIHKRSTTEVLGEVAAEISSATVGVASQLQSGALSLNDDERNANRVLENAEDPDDLVFRVRKLTPTGNKKNKEQTEPGIGGHLGSTAVSTILNFRQNLLTKQLIGGAGTPQIRAFAYDAFSKRNQAKKDYSKRLSGHFEKQNFSWAEIFDGLDTFGLSTSLESSYSHVVSAATPAEPGTTTSSWGTTLGVSQVLKDKFIVGLLGGHLARRSELNPNNDQKTALIHEKVQSLGVFVAYQDMEVPYYWSSFFSYGDHDYNSTRTWSHPRYLEEQSTTQDISSQAWSSHKGYDLSGNIELGYTFVIDQEVALQPFIGVGFANLNTPGYQETSIDIERSQEIQYGNIMYPELLKTQSRSCGLQGVQSFVIDNTAYQLSARLSYVTQKNNGDESVFKFSYLYAPETVNEIREENVRYHACEVMLGFNIAHDYQWIVSMNYTGSFATQVTSHSLVASAQYTFW